MNEGMENQKQRSFPDHMEVVLETSINELVWVAYQQFELLVHDHQL